MEEESCHNSHTYETSSGSLIAISSSSSSNLQIEKANYEDSNEHIQHNHWNQQEQLNNLPRINIHMTFILDDVWSCIVVLVVFWLIVGVHGSVNLQLGPYSSHLIEINSMLVQYIKVEQNNKQKPGLMLYGFDHPPPLDVKINWTETYDASIPAKSQKAFSNFEWIFYLNKDSQLDVFYNVKSIGAPLILVIAKGTECLIKWKKDPSFPNATLYWNNINGSGSITQKISHSSTYYVAIGNMNPQNVKVQLNFSVNAVLYNTSGSYQRCSLDDGLCILNPSLSENFALLTTPGPRKVNFGLYLFFSYYL
ncbi:E3 ubiquitin-protein ligase APD2-like [Trifolium pratense]|uniref:E3 ubiquitin-protein ligase APD2-like n=1 Tax=Trifolium pratense TaxID=57577 RepID=UPI001E696EA8|nr:E3 ubiquitin-protein ligase APD2-like [Trifolium pratense]